MVLTVLFLIVGRLAMSLVDVSENAPEPWVAMGYLSLKSKKFPRAVYFAQKVSYFHLCWEIFLHANL